MRLHEAQALSGDQLPIDLRQGLRQLVGVRDQRKAALSEDARKPAFAVAIHRDAKDRMTRTAGFAHSHHAVFDAVATLVMVQIIRFAIGNHQQKPPLAALLGQSRRHMADRGPKPGIMAGLQRGDALFHHLAHRLIETLGLLHKDPVPFQRGKGVDGIAVANRIQPPSQSGQSLAFDVDHRPAIMAVAGNRTFGRAGDIQQDRHRQIAGLRPCLAPDAVGSLAAGIKIDPRTHGTIRVQFVAIRVAKGRNTAGTQSLELAADGAEAMTLCDIAYLDELETLATNAAPLECQGKLVRVVSGSVFDVAVDIRKDSPTYGKWVGVELSAQNHRQLWIPPQLAHGFLVLSEVAEFLYKTTDYYHPQSEACLAWNDPFVGVEWPLPPGISPNMNAKDSAGLAWDLAPKF